MGGFGRIWRDVCVIATMYEISYKYVKTLIGKDKGHCWASAIVVTTPTRSEPSIAGVIVLENNIRGIFHSAERRH